MNQINKTTYNNAVVCRSKNRRIVIAKKEDGFILEMVSVLPKDGGKVLDDCFERGNFTHVLLGMSRMAAISLYAALSEMIEKDIEENPEQWKKEI